MDEAWREAHNKALLCHSRERGNSGSEFLEEPIRNTARLAVLSSIVIYAEEHGVAGSWLPVLKAKIKDWQEKYEASKQQLTYSALEREAVEVAARDTPEAYLDLSDKYYRANEFQSSSDAARAALALRPAYAEAFINLCAACNQLGYFEEGKKAGEEAVRLAPGNRLANGNLAASLRGLGIFDTQK